MFWLLLLSVFLIPILLLVVPIDIEFCYDSSGQIESGVHIVWLFGLVRFRSNFSDKRFTEKQGETAVFKKRHQTRQKGKDRRTRKKKGGSRVFLAVIRSKGFIRRVFRLLFDVITVAEIRQLRARVYVGLEDPADTGYFFGLLAPSFSILYAIPQVDFVAVPVFDREVIEANIKTDIRIVPISYVVAVLSFVFSKEFFRALRVAHRVYRA